VLAEGLIFSFYSPVLQHSNTPTSKLFNDFMQSKYCLFIGYRSVNFIWTGTNCLEYKITVKIKVNLYVAAGRVIM